MIGLERRIGVEREIHQQRAEKKERTGAWIDQRCVLSEPTEPGAPSEIALEEWAGVDVRLAAHRSLGLRFDPAMKLRQPIEQDVMIIIAAPIPCDRPARLLAAVVHGDDNRRRGAIEREARVAALRR